MDIDRDFYLKFYRVLHETFLKREYTKTQWQNYNALSSYVWRDSLYNSSVKPDSKGQPKVSVYFAGTKGHIAVKYFYDRYRIFISPKKKPWPALCEIEDLVLIKALVYIGVGTGLKLKLKGYERDKQKGLLNQKEERIDIDFEILENRQEWESANNTVVLTELIELFRKKYMSSTLDLDSIKHFEESNIEVDKRREITKSETNNFRPDNFETERSRGSNLDNSDQDFIDIRKKNPPKYLTSIPRRLDSFIGRSEEIRDLYKTLNDTKKIVFISGIPGIGKTSCAKFFVEKYESYFDHIAWISFDITPDKLVSGSDRDNVHFEDGFTQLYIFLNNGEINQTLSIRQRYQYTIDLLNNIRGNNLIIIDNAGESVVRLAEILHWKILATGRHKAPGTIDFAISHLPKDDAVCLFKTICEKKVDEALLNKFIIEVDGHTLMIEIAARCLNESNVLTLNYLYEKILSSQLNDVDLDQIVATERGIVGNLTKHLSCLFDVESLSDNEVSILKTWYYLLPKPYTLKEIEEFTQVSSETGNLKLILNSLSKKGWLSFNSSDETYTIHRLIQKTISFVLSPRLDDVVLLYRHYRKQLHTLNTHDISKLFQLHHSCKFLIDRVLKEEQSYSYSLTLKYDLALVHIFFHVTLQAKEILEELLIDLESFVNDEVIFLRLAAYGLEKRIVLINLADILIDLSEFDSAKDMLLEALTLPTVEADEKKESAQNFYLYNNLICVYGYLNDPENAMFYCALLRRDCVDSIPEDLDKRFLLERQIHILVGNRMFTSAEPMAKELFKQFTQEYNNSEMDSLSYAVKAAHHGTLLIGLDQLEEALECFYLASDIFEKLAIESPYVYDRSLARMLEYLTRTLLDLGERRDLDDKGKLLWNLYFRNLNVEPGIWERMINFALTLACNLPKPLPTFISEQIHVSLAATWLYSDDEEEWIEKFGLAIVILDLPNEYIKTFVAKIFIEAQKLIDNAKKNLA